MSSNEDGQAIGREGVNQLRGLFVAAIQRMAPGGLLYPGVSLMMQFDFGTIDPQTRSRTQLEPGERLGGIAPIIGVKRRRRRSGKRAARALERLRKARLAVEYLARGFGYERAAKWAGFRAKSSCWAAVQELLVAERAQASEEARALFGRRLDVLLAASMPDACEGDLEAMDRALAILDRMDHLYGFSKPTRIAPRTPEGARPASGALSWGDLMELAASAEQTGRGG